jgi:hypothetical protein
MKNFFAESIGLSTKKRVEEVAGRELTIDHQSYLGRIQLPVESYGICQVWYRNTKYGRIHNADEGVLANGLCMDCWDKGLGGQNTRNQIAQAKSKRKRKVKGSKPE